jgi:microcystin-dependent protein
LVIIVIYLIYKTRNLENFSSPTLNQDIINAINNKYKIDIDAMRNLSSISSSIMNNINTLTLPATTTTANKLTVSGDLSVAQNLVIGGNVVFSNKDNNILEIFPRGMIVAWWRNTRPKGWAPCDGKRYKLDSNMIAYEVLNSEPGITTPDLRSKFIIGANGSTEGATFTDSNNQSLTNRPFSSYGGEEKVTLTELQMPRHFHYEFVYNSTNVIGDTISNSTSPMTNLEKGDDSRNYIMQAATHNDVPTVGKTDSRGFNQSHNNMPPYFSLYYYMKL